MVVWIYNWRVWAVVRFKNVEFLYQIDYFFSYYNSLIVKILLVISPYLDVLILYTAFIYSLLLEIFITYKSCAYTKKSFCLNNYSMYRRVGLCKNVTETQCGLQRHHYYTSFTFGAYLVRKYIYIYISYF